MQEILKSIFIFLLDPVQLIGYGGMGCAFLSFQCKKTRNYYLMQTFCALLFMIQFALLGAWSGFLNNVTGILRGFAFLAVTAAPFARFKKSKLLILALELLCVASGVVSVLLFDDPLWIAGLLLLPMVTSTFAMWTGNGKTIRYVQLCIVSPIWLFYNIYFYSVGGIVCESFNILSVLVSFIRFRKSWSEINAGQ